jgi:signal peptidase II
MVAETYSTPTGKSPDPRNVHDRTCLLWTASVFRGNDAGQVMYWIPFLLSLVLAFALDQATKALVLAQLEERQAIVLGRLVIRRLIKRPAAAGFLGRPRQLLTLWAAEVILIVALFHFGPFAPNATAQVAVAAALGGAGGNVCDRLWHGGVVDFLDLRFWPVFNLGDAAIVIGVTVSILQLLT